MDRYMLTTKDNPFNPFDDFKAWYAFDVSQGHHTSSYLARIFRGSNELTEFDDNEAINDAIDEIISFDVENKYIRVKESDL